MILVTGGTGFIGSRVVSRLLADSRKVRVLARDARKAAEMFPQADIVEGDILKPETLQTVFNGVDTVIHLASMISYRGKDRAALREINVAGTRNMLEACKNARRFIYSSSVGVYGPVEEAADESYRLRPDTEYGKTKLEAEDLVRQSGMDYVALRMAPVYGAQSPIWKRILKLMDRRFPIPKNKNTTQILHVEDAADAFLLAVENGHGIYNIADVKPIGFTELAEKISHLLGREPKFWPPWLIRTAAIPMGLKKSIDAWSENRHYVISKAQDELGFRPKAELDAKLKEMVEWYKSLPQPTAP